MRATAAVGMVLTLASFAVPAVAQQAPVKPSTGTSREAESSNTGRGSVTGTVTQAKDNGIVVLGRDAAGKTDREWAFITDAGTRIDASGQGRSVSDLRPGDAVTVTYTTRDGKVVAQSVTVTTR